MMRTALVIYSAVAAVVWVGLFVLLLYGRLRIRRSRCRDAVLRRRYLQIVVAALLSEEPETPRFPMIGRAGSRLLLVETVAGVAAAICGPGQEPLQRIVAANDLETWLRRRIRRSAGFRRARWLALLAALPEPSVGEADRAVERALHSRNRHLRFQALAVRLAADPSMALRRIATYTGGFSEGEVAGIIALLRRGMLPIAYEPLLHSECSNLRRIGIAIVRQFGVEEAEGHLLRIVGADPVPELACGALYALCALRRPLNRTEVVGRIAAMDVGKRRALMRRMAREGYAAGAIASLLDVPMRSYYDSLVQSYKCSLV